MDQTYYFPNFEIRATALEESLHQGAPIAMRVKFHPLPGMQMDAMWEQIIQTLQHLDKKLTPEYPKRRWSGENQDIVMERLNRKDFFHSDHLSELSVDLRSSPYENSRKFVDKFHTEMQEVEIDARRGRDKYEKLFAFDLQEQLLSETPATDTATINAFSGQPIARPTLQQNLELKLGEALDQLVKSGAVTIQNREETLSTLVNALTVQPQQTKHKTETTITEL